MLPVIHIHIGTTLPAYFWDTVAQTRRFHSGPIFLVIPECDVQHPNVKILHCVAFAWTSFTGHVLHAKLEQISLLHNYGGDGFWHYALQRLLILEICMQKQGIERCIHIENDVVLYCDPSTLEGVLHRLYAGSVAVTPLGPSEGCTASFMYVDRLDALNFVNLQMVQLLQRDERSLRRELTTPMVHEMMLLGIIQRDHPDKLAVFPVTSATPALVPWLPRSAKPVFRPLMRLIDWLFPRTIRWLPKSGLNAHCEEFGMVFDAASYGQFMGGTPHGGGPGTTFVHHWVGPDLRSGRYTIEWDTDAQGRRCPFLCSPTEGRWKLANLHIHTKKIKDFV